VFAASPRRNASRLVCDWARGIAGPGFVAVFACADEGVIGDFDASVLEQAAIPPANSRQGTMFAEILLNILFLLLLRD
jgi:hypothetical protein